MRVNALPEPAQSAHDSAVEGVLRCEPVERCVPHPVADALEERDVAGGELQEEPGDGDSRACAACVGE
jgi:hypothetical protein